MGIVAESLASPGPLAASLAAGLNSLSGNQSVVFNQYARSVLPTDGYVFWVSNGVSITVNGSLHQIIGQNQNEDETMSINKILFTSTQEVTQFNGINSGLLWVGEWLSDGVTLKVVFNDTASIYQQSGLWHYSGDTVYPALQSQLIASAADLPSSPIVSNSLPIWLAQNSFAAVYPSYLVPSNISPPYIVAHIPPEDTKPIQQFPVYVSPGVLSGSNNYLMPSTQLMIDKVELTLYGFNNQAAIQYLSSLMDYSLNTDDFGFCNSPVIQDEKRKQSEISVLAMKKKITILASYYQETSDAVARRLILSSALNNLTTQ
ncbi:MAG: hypothetical protein B7Y55_01120 [Polynucleobacter sp. 35-46-207]|jgi:hypothetical protein|nr:MAG: hypothetical protein B7Y55_01120 [Polynucleobacter sp. 35-46-207]OZB49412.1 MAG: hypothetical protein B7X60_01230 [Polynucleobacter sp. 39-45-136]